MQTVKNLFHLVVAVLANIYYNFPAGKMTVVGITGTDGKTTTTHLIYHILKTARFPVSFISSVEANIMGKSIDTGFHVTTPSPFQLQKLIKMAYTSGTRFLVLEITSHALDQFRTFGSSVDIAVITNISHEHLDYHKNLDKYRQAKAKILRGTKFAVLNADDSNFSYLKKKAEGKVLSYSLNISSKSSKINNQGNPRLLGKFNHYNILAAATVARIFKIAPSIIKRAIKSFPGVNGRLELVKNRKHIKIFIDFAHKINALANVLKTVRKITPRQLIVVFGSAGLRDVTKRPLMGEAAAKHSDYIVLTAEDPRTEDVREIINQIAVGCIRNKAKEFGKSAPLNQLRHGYKYFFKIPDRQEAINFAIKKLAKRGDTVIICGKGHEQSMCYGTTEYPWDEKRAIAKALV